MTMCGHSFWYVSQKFLTPVNILETKSNFLISHLFKRKLGSVHSLGPILAKKSVTMYSSCLNYNVSDDQHLTLMFCVFHANSSYLCRVLILCFSHKCIKQCLEQSNRCPKCTCVIEKPDQIFPNFLCEYTTLQSIQSSHGNKIVGL